MKMVEYYIHLLETGVCSFEQSVRTSPSKTCIYEGDVNRTEHSNVCLRLKQLIYPENKNSNNNNNFPIISYPF